MGRQRRQERLRQRRRESAQRAPSTKAPLAARPAILRALDPFGGLPVVGSGILVVIVLGVLLWQNRPESASTEALMGDAVPFTSSAHVESESEMDTPLGAPPAAGPHFTVPQKPGIYTEPIAEGNAVHALEHGIVWFSYNPDLLAAEDLAVVTRVAEDHRNDVILAPRPANGSALFAVSWARRLSVATPVDEAVLREFVETNLNRSPEPGVR